MNSEIEELKNAVALSPENVFLRLMLIRKMQHLPFYSQEVEAQLNALLTIDSNNVQGKEILAGIISQKRKDIYRHYYPRRIGQCRQTYCNG